MSIAENTTAVAGSRSSLRQWIERRAEGWLAQRVPPRETAVLHRRNIYILPTRHGLLFIATAAVIFLAAINYELSLAFALAFLMVSLFLLSILHSFNNLRGLSVRGLGAEPAFAGEMAVFNVLVQRQSNRVHESMELHFKGGDSTYTSLVRPLEQRLLLSIPVQQRGRFKAPHLMVQSVFPLGLWRTWARLDLAQSCVVYPQPLPCSLERFGSSTVSGESSATTAGVEDFHGLRDYQPGDSLKQIAWKNLARGQGLKVKQFVDGVNRQRMLAWDMFADMPAEERLGCLCYLVLQMETRDCDYGLDMPGLLIEPGRGKAHQRHLLEVLALWP